MRVLVTGSNGFIGKNLVVSLEEKENFSVIEFCRGDSLSSLQNAVKNADFLVHLAGENRTKDLKNLTINNVDFTSLICEKIKVRNKFGTRVMNSEIGKEKFWLRFQLRDNQSGQEVANEVRAAAPGIGLAKQG